MPALTTPGVPWTLQGWLELCTKDYGRTGSGPTHPAPHPPWAGWVLRLRAGLYEAPHLFKDSLAGPGISQNHSGFGGPMAQGKSRSGLVRPFATLALATPRVSGHLPDPAGLAGRSGPGQVWAAAVTWPTLSTPKSSACPAGLLLRRRSSQPLVSLSSPFACTLPVPWKASSRSGLGSTLGHVWPCRSQGQRGTAAQQGSGVLLGDRSLRGWEHAFWEVSSRDLAPALQGTGTRCGTYSFGR